MKEEKIIAPINEDLNVVKYEEENIKNLIYTIRGKQVMLDSDVANLYHYKTKSLNLAVKRNIERFPEEFCFQLTENELESLRFQIETSKSNSQSTLQQEENIKQKIFFEGQIYDAYSLIIDIIKKAKSKITIIDNYIDDSILKMLAKKNKNVEVVILTSDKSNISKLDIQKFNKEYPTLKVSKTNKFHDRFIIIDNKELYHCGASIKDLGKKCFGINKIEDESIVNKFTEKIT